MFCIFLFEEEISKVCALVDHWFDERSLAGHQSGDAWTMSRKDAVAVYYNADGDGTGDEVASITGICVLNCNDIAKAQLIQSILLADLFVVQGNVVVTVIRGGSTQSGTHDAARNNLCNAYGEFAAILFGDVHLFQQRRAHVAQQNFRIIQQLHSLTPVSYTHLDVYKRQQKRHAAMVQQELFAKASATALSGSCDLLVLDEIMTAINSGMVEAEQVKQLLCGKPEELEVVLTGRNPPQELIELADYVSQIQKVKHPFDRGIAARDGIER